MVRRVYMILLALFALAQVAHAAPRKIDVQLYGYSLALPEGWSEAPESVFNGLAGSLRATRGAVADLVFLRHGKKPAEQPVIAVLRFELSAVGDIGTHTLRQHADKFNREMAEQLQAFSRSAPSLIKSFRPGTMRVDEATQSFMMPLRLDIERAGSVSFQMRGFVGKKHLILFYMVATDAYASAGESAFDAIVASFRFTPDAAHPASAFVGPELLPTAYRPSDGPSPLDMLLFAGLILLCVGSLGYLAVTLRRRGDDAPAPTVNREN